MRRYVLSIAASLALTACGSGEKTTTIVTNAATGRVTATGDVPPSPAALGLKPGKWQTTVTISDLKLGGVPHGAGDIGPPKMTSTTCLTPEQAAKGPGEMLQQAKADCTARSSSFADGRLASDASCTTPAGAFRVRTTGRYTPTTVTSDAAMEMNGAMAMSQRMHIEARRIGDCDHGG